MNDRIKLIAPCGLDCGSCELYLSRNNEQLMKHLVSTGIPEEVLPCDGCSSLEGKCPVIHGQCETYRCAVEKEIKYCYECDDFPCTKLAPAADKANILPHNLKVYNLCMMNKIGPDQFIKESQKIKETYFTGKMVIGEGPAQEKE